MSFVFNLRKSTQMAGVFLSRADNRRMPYMKLVKLIHFGDRESLRDNGFPMSGDSPWAMPHGASPSALCDYAAGKLTADDWTRYVRTDAYDAVLQEDPGDDLLSAYEVGKLNELFDRFSDYDQWDMSKLTHDVEEYDKDRPAERSSKPIPLEDILAAVGREADIESIKQRREDDRSIASILGA